MNGDDRVNDSQLAAGLQADDREDLPSNSDRSRLSRRSMLRGALFVGAGAVGGGLVGGFGGQAVAGPSDRDATAEQFWGQHQAGIVTGTQQQTVLAAFDLTGGDRADLKALLKEWTALAAKLVEGRSVPIPGYTPPGSAASYGGGDTSINGVVFSEEAAFSESPDGAYADVPGSSALNDSLEAVGLGSSRLTMTIGFGRSLFITGDGKDRFGLASKLPAALINLPHFSGEQLDAADSGGDLFLQACSDNPQVAFHAVRSIARIAPDVATLRWSQVGFSPGNEDGTPRNLTGFKDGTVNSNVHPPADLDATLWAAEGSPPWMRGGSYLVYRRIRIALEQWDRLAPHVQEQVIGRKKLDGAPLGGTAEFSPLDLDGRNAGGDLVLPENAHVRLSAPQSNGGAVIVRRAFSYNNGTAKFVERWAPDRGALEFDAGLLFLAYQKDPRTAFVPIFTKLAEHDPLNKYTTHTASAVFAMPPGANSPGDWIGRPLFE